MFQSGCAACRAFELAEAFLTAVQPAPHAPLLLPPPPSPSAASVRSRRSSAAGDVVCVLGGKKLYDGHDPAPAPTPCASQATMRTSPSEIDGVHVFLAFTGNSAHTSVHGGPPLAAEGSWEVLRAPHGRLTAAAAANNGANVRLASGYIKTYDVRPSWHADT